MRLTATLRGERAPWEKTATVLDIHLAGAGVETDDPLVPGERVTIAFAAPTRWDPLVVPAVVAWADALRPKQELDAFGRPRAAARAGLAFAYASPDAVLAMFEMLSALGFE